MSEDTKTTTEQERRLYDKEETRKEYWPFLEPIKRYLVTYGAPDCLLRMYANLIIKQGRSVACNYATGCNKSGNIR